MGYLKTSKIFSHKKKYTTKHIAQRVSKRLDYPEKDTLAIIYAFHDEMTRLLFEHNAVCLNNIGFFTTVKQKRRIIKNNYIGVIDVPEHTKLTFIFYQRYKMLVKKKLNGGFKTKVISKDIKDYEMYNNKKK